MTSTTLTRKNSFCLPLAFSWILAQDLRHSLQMKIILGWQSYSRSPMSPHQGSSWVKLLVLAVMPVALSCFLDSRLPLTPALGIFLSTLLPGCSSSRHGKCWESSILVCPCQALPGLHALFPPSVPCRLFSDLTRYSVLLSLCLLSVLFWDLSSGRLCFH